MSTNKIVVPVADDNYTGEGGGTYGYISWQTIETLLREIKQVREGEQLAGLYATDNGIHFEVRKE